MPEKNNKNLPSKSSGKMVTDINLQSLVTAAINKQADIGVINQLLDMRERLKNEAAAEMFREAMSLFQSECPIIDKSKAVYNSASKGGGLRYKYAPLDVIVKQVQPLLAKCGLSYDIDTIIEDAYIKIILTVSHIAGHSKTTNFSVPVDKDAYMTDQQKWAAACTFAKRYAFLNGFGILTGDEDTDGPEMAEPKSKQVDIPGIIEKALELINSSTTVKALNTRGAQIKNYALEIPDIDRAQIREALKNKMDELQEKENA